MTAHSVPAVIDALLVLLGDPPDANGVRMGTGALAGVRIVDGPPLDDMEQADLVVIGLSIEDVSAATGRSTPGWGDDRSESYDLSCLTQSWTGDVDMAPRRARALVLLDVVRSLLLANRELGGACDWARLAGWTYRPIQTPKGALALTEFTVRVDATRFEGA